jgi:hypothetical protein
MENKKIQSIKEKGCFNCAHHHMNGPACNCKTKCFSGDQWKQTKESKEFELKYCEKCIQMTNHIDGICQKCKPVKSAEEISEKIKQIIRGKINKHLVLHAPVNDDVRCRIDILIDEAEEEISKEYASQSEPINQKLLEACKSYFSAPKSKTFGYKSDEQIAAIDAMKEAIKQAEQLKQ